jgi:PBSX family phage terminase large subunit
MEFGLFGKKALDFILTPIEKDARINILEGSVRSGKTVSMIPKWLNYIKNGPKGLLVITGVSKETIYDNVLQDLFDTVGENNYRYNSQTGVLKMYGRKIKIIGAKDDGSEKYIRGKTLAGAYCDELSLMPEKFFKQLLNRLSIKGAKLYGTTNPDSPFHYLNVEYITDKKKLASGMVKVYHFELDDNPNLDDEYKSFIRQAYSGLWYQRMILGLWVLAEGIIYPEFNKEKHCIEEKDLPAAFDKIFITSDYGITNPQVFLKCGIKAIDGKQHLFILNEYYNVGKSGKAKTDLLFFNDFRKFVEGINYKKVIIDPSATSLINLFKENGISVKEADNSVSDGIANVSTWLAQERIHIVEKKCPNILKEFATYIWDERAQKRGKDEPLKTNDHALDALRYLIQTLFPIRKKVTLGFA